MKVEGFNTEKLNGTYTLIDTRNLEFDETRSIFLKEDLRLILWYDFNKEMYGGRISSLDPLKIYSFYDMKKGWSDNGKWLTINLYEEIT